MRLRRKRPDHSREAPEHSRRDVNAAQEEANAAVRDSERKGQEARALHERLMRQTRENHLASAWLATFWEEPC